MKKLYLILTLLGLTVLTSFGVLAKKLEFNASEIYVVFDRGGYLDQYSIPYETEYIYFEWEYFGDSGSAYEGRLDFYNQDNLSLFGEDFYFDSPNYNDIHYIDFFIPLSFTSGASGIQDIFEQNILYTRATIDYHVNDGFTINFNDRDSSAFSLSQNVGEKTTSPNIWVVTPYNFYQSGVAKGYQDGYDKGFNDGLANTRSYQDGLKEGQQQGYDIGYDEGRIIGQEMGYDQAREYYGYYHNGQWITAKAWGQIQFSTGQTSETNYFDIMFTGFFGFITALGGIQLLPGLYIWHFVVFPLVFGIIFFIIGRSGGDNNKGGKK